MLRRRFLSQAAGLAAAAPIITLHGPSAFADPAGDDGFWLFDDRSAIPAQIAFDIIRKGDRIGEHIIAFTPTEQGLQVDVDIRIKVKFLFITAYSYHHQIREHWVGDRLQSYATRTRDNGKDLDAHGQIMGDDFELTDATGAVHRVPHNTLLTSYWHPDTRTASRLINSQTGAPMDVRLVPVQKDDPLIAPWGEVRADKLRVEADRQWYLWIDSMGCLFDIAFTGKDGTEIRYELKRHLDPQTAPWINDAPLLSPYVNNPMLARQQSSPSGQG
ncbi:hypothetical protein JCM17846_00350 [Iodidimonas nitroreducens]|uniref:Uncharacterized protein n=1 Tax=Iodidimonas nitroreducens TaxID=1236968 RepID=A0A5A7N246_9PROT|nr:DUF6134 family protein [Iodidimonas nitroreducens]GAK34901.1 hypothetical protein AQ1_02810 [alpha proteobacterium Q-1]GER02353.1 hypothetical protein JCM17846_00350 [Iodidimonas nitroreducens]